MRYSSNTTHRETLVYATYYAPHGRVRLYHVAHELSEKYLSPTDLLIGIIGAEGSGKSTLIKGLFPGLELTNDDDGINVQPTPLYHFSPEDPFSGHTFHIDVRYELAFHQIYEIVEAVNNAISHHRRVIVEHFDLLYGALGYNAQVIFGIGEEIIVARPTVFGPFPKSIKSIVHRTIKFRRMAHSAEDLTYHIIKRQYRYVLASGHSDVKQGFVLTFPHKPDIDIAELERKVLDVIAQDVAITAVGEDRISIGSDAMPCTGTRTHVKSSGMIENYRLLKDFKFDPITKEYYLVGLIGKKQVVGYENMIDISHLT
jgi:GTPase SAR1 family protein